MIYYERFSYFIFVYFSICGGFAQSQPIRYDFSENSLQSNEIRVQGAGFGIYPLPEISFGAIPTDNVFTGATDGKGLIIQADPGEGVMIVFPIVKTDRSALIRCSVRASTKDVSVYLASIDQGEYSFVSTITPNNGIFFLNRWKRIANFCLPPSTGFQPILQILNNSAVESMTTYVDNVEIYVLEKGKFYNEEFLDGDEEDPEVIRIAQTDFPASPTPINATPTPTPSPTPTPQSNITINLPDLSSEAKQLEMVLIPAGTFSMGSSDAEQDRFPAEGPQHQVTITKPFYLGKYEVTQAQWEAVVGRWPSYFGGQPNNPVEQISWYDCQDFLDLLNLLDLGTFRLPTEAEWEYACRAGTVTRFYWGDDQDYTQTDDYAWYYDNSKKQTHKVGSRLPNAWGLFDMSGNVWEWCQDWYGAYTEDAQVDPQGPDNGVYKVLRGGSWDRDARNIRSARRSDWCPENWSDPAFTAYYSGCRLVRNL